MIDQRAVQVKCRLEHIEPSSTRYALARYKAVHDYVQRVQAEARQKPPLVSLDTDTGRPVSDVPAAMESHVCNGSCFMFLPRGFTPELFSGRARRGVLEVLDSGPIEASKPHINAGNVHDTVYPWSKDSIVRELSAAFETDLRKAKSRPS